MFYLLSFCFLLVLFPSIGTMMNTGTTRQTHPTVSPAIVCKAICRSKRITLSLEYKRQQQNERYEHEETHYVYRSLWGQWLSGGLYLKPKHDTSANLALFLLQLYRFTTSGTMHIEHLHRLHQVCNQPVQILRLLSSQEH